MKSGGALLALALGASSALAQTTPYEGDWAIGDPEACFSGEGDASNPMLRIRGTTAHFPESLCQLNEPQPIEGLGATLYTLDCTGEGERWSLRTLLMLQRDGALIALTDGIADILPRCRGYSDQRDPPSTPSPLKTR